MRFILIIFFPTLSTLPRSRSPPYPHNFIKQFSPWGQLGIDFNHVPEQAPFPRSANTKQTPLPILCVHVCVCSFLWPYWALNLKNKSSHWYYIMVQNCHQPVRYSAASQAPEASAFSWTPMLAHAHRRVWGDPLESSLDLCVLTELWSISPGR